MKNDNRTAMDIFDSVLKPEYINVEVTNIVREQIKRKTSLAHPLFAPTKEYSDLLQASKELFNCCDIKHTVLFIETDKPKCEYECLSLNVRPESGLDSYVLHIFANVTLVYFKPYNKRQIFMAAVNNTAIHISIRKENNDVTQIIYEKSKENIRYYDKFSPVPDSKIVSSYWNRVNADGSRSFAGGLKPENNPLHFVLEYGIIEFGFCDVSLETAFSNAALAESFSNTCNDFLSGFENQCSTNTDANKIWVDAKKHIKKKLRKIKYLKLTIPLKITAILSFILALILFVITVDLLWAAAAAVSMFIITYLIVLALIFLFNRYW